MKSEFKDSTDAPAIADRYWRLTARFDRFEQPLYDPVDVIVWIRPNYGLNRTVAIVYRLQTAKKPETRARRMKMIVNMLERGERFHP